MKAHGFPADSMEQQRWIDALSNLLPIPVTKNITVCVKHWPPNYESFKRKGYYVTVNPPSIISVPPSFLRKNCSNVPRNIEARNVDR